MEILIYILNRKRKCMNKIQIYLNDKKDYISKFNQERISKELYGYIKNEVKLININKKIKIKIT